MHDSTFSQNLDSLFTDLHNLVNTETVLGNPLTVGEKTLIPVMAVTLGYGSTGMGTKVETPETKHSSNGIGLGARISTSAIVVMDNQGTSILPINGHSSMAQLMQNIPQALTNLGSTMMGQGMNQGQKQGQQGQQSSSSNGMNNSNNQNQGSSGSSTSDIS